MRAGHSQEPSPGPRREAFVLLRLYATAREMESTNRGPALKPRRAVQGGNEVAAPVLVHMTQVMAQATDKKHERNVPTDTLM